MKQKISKFFLLASIVTTISGCSSLIESSRKMIDEEEAKQNQATKATSDQNRKWVSQDQYNELLTRYEDLSQKYESLKDDKGVNTKSFNQGAELAQSNPTSETVDVFGKGGMASQVEEELASLGNQSTDLSRELNTYKKAVALKENGKVDEALKIFQLLERSGSKQLHVRARAQVGSIYLSQKQFDLALQVFERMIAEDAFSGKVLYALEGAVQSCDGLNLTDKKLRYQSMLRDFFGIKG